MGCHCTRLRGWCPFSNFKFSCDGYGKWCSRSRPNVIRAGGTESEAFGVTYQLTAIMHDPCHAELCHHPHPSSNYPTGTSVATLCSLCCFQFPCPFDLTPFFTLGFLNKKTQVYIGVDTQNTLFTKGSM